MTTPRKPSLKKVKEHFSQAREVFCLKSKIPVNIASVKSFIFNEADRSFTTIGGAVMVWKDGLYAEITKKKCNPADCKECAKCKENQKK